MTASRRDITMNDLRELRLGAVRRLYDEVLDRT